MCDASVGTRAMDGLVERFSNATTGNGSQENNDVGDLLALYSYSYVQNGQQVSFEAGDRFILIEKFSEDWWHVLNPRDNTMLYVPANYVCTSSSTTDFGEDESSDSLNSQGETNTLSPSSESSGQDYEENPEHDFSEEATSFGSTTSTNSDEVIYANIPVKSSDVKRREVSQAYN